MGLCLGRCRLGCCISVDQGQVLLILEAMKMETEVIAPCTGTITDVYISVGDSVAVGDNLISLKTT